MNQHVQLVVNDTLMAEFFVTARTTSNQGLLQHESPNLQVCEVYSCDKHTSTNSAVVGVYAAQPCADQSCPTRNVSGCLKPTLEIAPRFNTLMFD